MTAENQFPPPGFIKSESAVEGIAVYVPKPPEEEHQEVVSFKCPNCGADRAYSAVDGGLRCPVCGYHEVQEAEVVGKYADEFEFTVDTLQTAAHGWGIERMDIQCQNCGAVTTQPPDSMTHVCPFCQSQNVVQQLAPQDLLRPRFLVPLTVDEAACQANTKTWLGSSWMTPADLSDQSVLRSFTPLFVPFWTFDSITTASWKAEVGHTRTVGSGKNRRTTTVWKWESGNVRLDIDDLLISGTTHVSEVLLNRAANFDTNALVPYDPAFLAGIHAQAYERDLDTCWEMARHTMRERTKQACINQASSSKIRNFSMNMDFSDERWRYILLPVYVAAYYYKEEMYQILVNGQNGTVAGQRPVAWRKVSGWVAAALAPGTLALLIGLIAYALDSSENPGDTLEMLRLVGIGGFFLFAIAAGWTYQTITTALSYDDF